MKGIHCTVCIAAFWLWGQWADAQEAFLPFQGHLTRPVSGSPGEYEPVPSGQYSVTFSLYTSPAGGEGLVWGPENHEKLVVVGGLVNVLLGSVLGFGNELASDPNFFRRILYVGISIDADGNPATPDLELVPRQILLPAVQSLNSDKLDGRDWRDFFDGTDAAGTFTPGMTKARDANLFDGIDSAAVFVNPNDTVTPKVKRAAVADELSGGLVLNGDLTVQGGLTVSGATVLNGTVTSDLRVAGNLSSVTGGIEYHLVPQGTIAIWSGLAADIPSGWVVCDGENGTPDLRDRFVRGAGSDETVGATGGSGSHTHTYSGTTGQRGATAGVLAAFTGGSDWFTESHTHTYSGTTAFAGNLPPFYTLIFIMRV